MVVVGRWGGGLLVLVQISEVPVSASVQGSVGLIVSFMHNIEHQVFSDISLEQVTDLIRF